MPEHKENPRGGNQGGDKIAIRSAYKTQRTSASTDVDVRDFKHALEQAGLPTKDKIMADGKLRRFNVHGDKAGSKNGWYVLYGGNLPAGAFGSWKTGYKGTWCSKTFQNLTLAEREEYKRRMDAARKVREAEEQAWRKAASDKALAIWKASPPAPENYPYLVKKHVRSHGLRVHKDALVVPMRDSAGYLHNLQFIDGEGRKRFLSGGRKKGCYFIIGNPTDRVCIAEGYATAASIHQATGLPIVVAFDAGNLLPVALEMRKFYPAANLIICADNDAETPGNPGLTKAKEAAKACGALVAVPPIAGDFNDLYTGGAR